MRCRYCHEFFTPELTFETLVHQDDICPSCREIRRTPLLLETIPYYGGYIDYYYLLEEICQDPELFIKYDAMIDKALEKAISECDDNCLLLYIDEREFRDFPNWSFIMGGFIKTIFISSVRYDFSHYEGCF